jgi:metallo-beta-lactamase class B
VEALALTATLARREGRLAVPDTVPGLSSRGVVGAGDFQLLFPGPGHTPDNIVAYFPRQRVLFGGCLVKADTATTRGYVGEADLAAWPASVLRVRAAFPALRTVVPGHGAVSGPGALPHTARMFTARAAPTEPQ